MKFYDKELVKTSDNIKNIVYMLIIFSLGVLVGCFAMSIERGQAPKNNEANNVIIQQK